MPSENTGKLAIGLFTAVGAAIHRIHTPGGRFEQYTQFDVPYALEVDDSLIEGVVRPLSV
jgi:hypothetical protein